jgi:Transcriptional regulator
VSTHSSNIQSVIKTFSLIEVLSQNEKGLNIKELEEQLEMHKSSIYRIIFTLMDIGYITKTNDNYYRLTLKVLGLGNKLLNDISIIDIVKPYLMEVSMKTNETTHLVMFEGIEAIYLDVIHPKNNSFRANSFIGKRGPLYATAVGKIYLASLCEAELDKKWALMEKSIIKFTSKTITNLSELKIELEEIKKNSYATDNEEHEPNVFCIGVPVFSHNGEVQHAISVTFPKSKMNNELFNESISFLKNCSQKISEELGYKK